jgi:hypothetical protein
MSNTSFQPQNYQIFDQDAPNIVPSSTTGGGPAATITTSIVDNAQEFESRVKNYISVFKPKLYILTPCYGGMCHVDYLTCLMQTVEMFRNYNFPLQIEFCKNDSLVTRARNNLVARAMTDKDMTHIMFIDSDICWSPMDILKLVISNKEVVGGIYPLKNYDWRKLTQDPLNPYNSNVVKTWVDKKNSSQLSRIISDEQMIQYNMVRYNVNYLSNYLTIENNLTEVRHIATGFMMVKRNVFAQMFKAMPETKYTDDVSFLRENENENAYALFDTAVEVGHYFSEDWLFCSRWNKLGGKVYADVSINLSHNGVETFNGSYISSII